MERIVGRKTTRERTGHDPFHGKYDPYEVLDGVYAFSLAGRIPYYMDAAGSAEEECIERVAAKDIEAMKAYSFYGGLTNYKNLWLYARSF